MSQERPPMQRFQLATLKAAAWLMSIGLSVAAAQAATRDPNGPNGPMGGRSGADDTCMMAGERGQMPRIAELQKSLGLDAKQEAAWTKAMDTTQQLYKELLDTRRASRDRMKAVLDAPAPDLRALADQSDKDRDAELAKRKQAREAWLRFYDDLKPEQKQKASQFLLHQIGMFDGHGHHESHTHPPGGGMRRGDGPPPEAPRAMPRP